MSKSMYQVNPKLYNKRGRKRPGAVCETIKIEREKEDVSKTDRNNRTIVAKAMVQYVEKGVNPEKAAIMISHNPKVRKAFEYLINACVDLKELFVSFYTTEINKKKEDEDITR